jgi:hypothetical protein
MQTVHLVTLTLKLKLVPASAALLIRLAAGATAGATIGARSGTHRCCWHSLLRLGLGLRLGTVDGLEHQL